jgi:chloramphenicol-sensitive protein RarD
MFSFALKPLKVYQSIDILFYRVFFAAMILIVYSFFFNKNKMKANYQKFISLPKNEKLTTIKLTLFGGALLTANWFVFIFVINQISIKAAAYAYLVCPILTTLFAFIIIKEKLLKHQWVAVAISIASIVILAIYNFNDLMFSMIVAVSYALYLVSQRKNTNIDKLPILMFQMIFSAILLLPFYPYYSGPTPVQEVFYVLILVIAIVFTIVPLLLNLYAIEGLPSSTVGILLYINPILNFIVAVVYFNEKTYWYQWLSYTLVGVSILVFNKHILFNKKQEII